MIKNPKVGKKNKNFAFKKINFKLFTKNIVWTIFGVILTLVALFVAIDLGYFYRPIIEDIFVSSQGFDYFYEKENLQLIRYSDEKIDYDYSWAASSWRIRIKNKGKATAKNAIVLLKFNLTFEPRSIYDYEVDNPTNGSGFMGLKYEIGDILPDQTIELPIIPFLSSYILYNEQKIKMNMQIIVDNYKSFNKDYVIEVVDSDLERRISEGELELNKFIEIIDMLFGTYYYMNDIVYNPSLKLPENDLNLNDIEFAYKYSLKFVDSVREKEMKKFALLFGREYYSQLCTIEKNSCTKSDIDTLVNNDITIYSDNK
ncbi:MAG: hypothetical protein ACM3O4_03630 [Ignavibacteriales bacterium]